MDIGSKIKEYRKRDKLTQLQLATKSNISRSYLADVEKDRYNPSLETIKAIADALNVPLAEFFKVGIKEDNIEKWSKSLNVIEKEEDKIKYMESIVDFAEPAEAMKFILKQPSIMGFGGFDIATMSDEDIVSFANELLNQLKLLSYKYKK
ncbi:helix-turn-helix domain-containing protein [Clostridium gasigenes]|uniref:Helix-turn-helix transcriptional regulator n=1 Tax=Clostridium gasigenes TaxID=94869 RepID=A0A7X0SEW7_9CLOT|nr:helix-turn-helix transcriptional regulator [Clostridium gasigenes]MBB6716331.1 helix-turn-helix transcriptional regulator [Clostridium gasigenes]